MNAKETEERISQLFRDILSVCAAEKCEYDVAAKGGTGRIHKRYTITVDVLTDTAKAEKAGNQ